MVLLDTGSSDLVSSNRQQCGWRVWGPWLIGPQWVVSSDCTAEDCAGVPKYEKSGSLSLTDVPFHLNYLMGNVTGVVGSDTVTLGEFQND